MHVRSLHGNREISSLTVGARMGWRPASGRRGAEADDVRAGEVRPSCISDEAGEQSRATGSGIGRAKARGRREHGKAAHVPDAEPGKRATGAGPCTTSSKGKEEAEVHHSIPPSDSRFTE